jgi:DNA-binding response OmpR family regulator
MWKPRRFPQFNAVILEACPHGRRFLTENLYRMGIARISHVFSPAELATAIWKFDYKFVFVDWGTGQGPRGDAYTVVKEWSRTRDIRQLLIMTTADSRESNLKLGVEIGCDAIILKPYSPLMFCTRVSWAFGRRKEAG